MSETDSEKLPKEVRVAGTTGALSGVNQIVCSECGSGLTPDFFSMRNLKR